MTALRKNTVWILSLILLLLISVPAALSYFYTYTNATGTIPVHLEDGTTITEDVPNTQKQITITADEDSDPVFVRVKVFASDVIETGSSTEGWELRNDGCYYYSDPIDGKEGNDIDGSAYLEISVSLSEGADPETLAESYNVIVIYEATPALIDDSGALYADWNNVIDGGNA